MSEVTVEHNVPTVKLDAMNVESWPIWEKEISTFPWEYDQSETCYILDGMARITLSSDEEITIQEGDLVHFPAGLSCTWEVLEPIRKHYIFK